MATNKIMPFVDFINVLNCEHYKFGNNQSN